MAVYFRSLGAADASYHDETSHRDPCPMQRRVRGSVPIRPHPHVERFRSAQLFSPAAPCARNGANLLTLAGTSRSDAAKMDAGELAQVGQA